MLWRTLHCNVVGAMDAAGLQIWMAMASLLAVGRHGTPLPWHGLAEYGFHAHERSQVVRALSAAGLQTHTKRGILRAFMPSGVPIRSVYGRRALSSVTEQSWPWADLFPYGDGGRGGFCNVLYPAFEAASGNARIHLASYRREYFAGQWVLVPMAKEARRRNLICPRRVCFCRR